MLERLASLFGGSRRPSPSKPWFYRGSAPSTPEDLEQANYGWRRWAGAKTNRLNAHQWLDSLVGGTLNEDLASYLDNLRERCCLEAERNEYLKGVINTHAMDIVGESGPTLHIHSDNDAYSTWAERVWRDWWQPSDLDSLARDYHGPDINNQLSGIDLLNLWVKSQWKCGEHLFQFVTDNAANTPIKLRIADIHPRRLGTPTQPADLDVVMGVKITPTGKPLIYYVGEPDSQPYRLTENHTPIAAGQIVHQFMVEEAGQVRGVPWAATSLQGAADLRQYDEDVLDCADQAASMGIAWYSDHPSAEFFEVNETTDMRPRQQWTGPPGWKPMQINPQQPTQSYVEFRKERLAGIGRPVSMPLLIVRLTAERHTYSSARMDVKMYERALGWYQGWLARGTLNPCVVRVLREAELAAGAGRLNPMPPKPPRVGISWTWPKLPHVDPQKEANGERTRLENGTLPFTDACAAHGLDEDMVIEKWQRTNQKLVAAGAEPIPSPMAYLAAQISQMESASASATTDPEEDDDDAE